MNKCPHCGAEDNTGGTFLCGTRYVGYVGTETFRSQQCRDRVTYKKRSKDKVNHIPDTGKMVSDTPRTDAAYFKPYATMYDLAGEMKLMERELQEAQERIRLLIAERDSARQQADQSWKLREEFAALLGTDDVKEAVRRLQEANKRIKRLEEAGNRMYVLLDPASICMRTTEMDNALQGWDDAKISTTQTK